MNNKYIQENKYVIALVVVIVIVILIILYITKIIQFEPLTNVSNEHLTNVSNEGLQNLSSMYNSSTLTTSNLNVTNDASINGKTTVSNLNVTGDASINGKTTCGDDVFVRSIFGNGPNGRMNIGGNESLFLLNKNGVNISKAWGGTGDLTVEGNLNLGTITGPNRLHITGNESLYILNKNGTILSKAWGGNGNLTVEGSLTAHNSVPGAWLLNGNFGAFPIFGSIMNLNDFFMGDIDDRWIVMPGYKLLIWKDFYKTGPAEFDNTTGTKPLMSPEVKTIAGYNQNNNTSSCQLFFGDTEVPWL